MILNLESLALEPYYLSHHLQPYMKDQKMIWNDLDKFIFKKDAVTNAIIEYNKFYVIEATPAEKE